MLLLNRLLAIIDNKPCIVSISHSDIRSSIGGTEKLILLEKEKFIAAGYTYIHIFPSGHFRGISLFGVAINNQYSGFFSHISLGEILRKTQDKNVQFSAIHIHHFLGHSHLAIQYLIERIKAPVRFFIHDFYTACPQVNFMKNGSEFCGGPPTKDPLCTDCNYNSARLAQHSFFDQFFRQYCDEIIAPSRFSADLWCKTFPQLAERTSVVPHLKLFHETPKVRTHTGRPRIAYVGYTSRIKGFETWSRFAKKFNDRFDLFHMGDAAFSYSNVTHVPVELTGENSMSNVLKKYNIDIAFLWSIVPETYSFTLFESLSAGCLIVTNKNSGNIAATAKDLREGLVFSSESELFDFFENKADQLDLEKNLTFKEFISNPQLITELPKNRISRERVETLPSKFDICYTTAIASLLPLLSRSRMINFLKNYPTIYRVFRDFYRSIKRAMGRL